MRGLLDTHAFLWWLDGDRRLSRKARALIGDRDHDVLVSAASAWEITTKARLGKLPGAVDVAADVAQCIASQAFSSLDITVLHAQRAGRLPVTTAIDTERRGSLHQATFTVEAFHQVPLAKGLAAAGPQPAARRPQGP